jgi:general L-amino acid transport system permease protein
MPAIRVVCVTFIEFWRGVPLITVLFMSSVMLPLFLPEGMNFDKLLRALIGVILFQSAYAGWVRGGLQAIPKGQYRRGDGPGLLAQHGPGDSAASLEAGDPRHRQHLHCPVQGHQPGDHHRPVRPAQQRQASRRRPEMAGHGHEGYVFAALVFWIFCFGMSRYSMHLERKLDTGHKR